MADWADPVNATSHTVVWDKVKERDDGLARMFDGTLVWSNLVTNTIRLNRTTKRFEKWDGAAWVLPFTEPWLISVDKVDGEHGTDFASAVGAAANRDAKDSALLEGQNSNFYRDANNIAFGLLALTRGGTNASSAAAAFNNIKQPASEVSSGAAEIATQSETNVGSDNVRYITPLKLHSRTATTSRLGIAEIATQAEVDAGTDTTRYVTPDTLNSALGASALPSGVIVAWPAVTAPTGWLLCNGASRNTTTDAALFAVIGYTYGGSGASFSLPDYRGRFLRATSLGTGVDPDAGSRTNRGDGTTGDNVGTKQPHDLDSHTHGAGSYTIGGNTSTGVSTISARQANIAAINMAIAGTSGATGGNETRPKNTNVNWIIRK